MTSMLSLSQEASASLSVLLEKPLIAGASVSADHSAPSPGKKLALRYTSKDKVKTIAFNGRPGVETLKSINDQVLKDRSILIGIDLFFWDSVLPSSRASLEALDKLFKQSDKYNLPLVLGEIPGLMPSRQPSRNKLNQAIRQGCAQRTNCYVMPFDQLLRQVLANGYLEIKGKRYTLPQLVPDGLHLNHLASEEIADRLQTLLEI